MYTEKEILSVVAKAGVNANSIPDIIQGLIDDALVEKEKIGGSNYFWSFKAKKDRMAQIQNEKTLKLIEELKPQVAEAEARLSDAKRGREEEEDDDDDDEEEKDLNLKDNGNEEKKDKESSDDATSPSTINAAATSTKKRVGDDGSGRAKKLARLSELGQQKNELEKELEKLKENDPAALADLEKELQLVIQSANRWTDNIFECKSYLVKKRGMEKKEANKFLQISADFDCAYYYYLFSFLSLCFCSVINITIIIILVSSVIFFRILYRRIVIIRYSYFIPSHTILFFFDCFLPFFPTDIFSSPPFKDPE